MTLALFLTPLTLEPLLDIVEELLPLKPLDLEIEEFLALELKVFNELLPLLATFLLLLLKAKDLGDLRNPFLKPKLLKRL